MKISAFTLFSLLSAISPSSVSAECAESMEYAIGSARKLSFIGFTPTKVNRMSNHGEGNKVVLRGFDRKPDVQIRDDIIAVTAGEPCVPVVEEPVAPTPASVSEDTAPTAQEPTSSAARLAGTTAMGLGLSWLSSTSQSSGILTLGLLTAFLNNNVMFADAQLTEVVCPEETIPIEIDIYVDASVNDLVMQQAQSGNYEICPPESLYWKHHPSVYGGYEGCVGENAYYPCAQDSQGQLDEGGNFALMYPLSWDGQSCVETGYTTETRTYWVLWGDPMDKHELNKRTQLNPVVSFPFNRGPYPDYARGVDIDEAFDDTADARAMAKDFLVYLGGFTAEELNAFDITFTEGAESGMIAIWAGKALELARTTCNRDFHVLMEAPAYGYNPGDSAAIVNKFASSFYNSTECSCFEADTCRTGTVTIRNRGWMPGSTLPSAAGDDGEMYMANSVSPLSPWFESMVFPENPSGVIKTPQLPVSRRVCDMVYMWPMYFGNFDYKIPMDLRPDCSAYSFSITKAYSASVRAGFIMYREDPVSNHDAMVDSTNDMYTMTNGLYSEWSWYGQMQIWEMIMSREVSDPTSWIGAYSSIMEEKWNLVIDGFKDCPVMTLSNPKAGAYAYFVFNEPYLGLQENSFIGSFFRDVLGVRATTYDWGFRGADPAAFYPGRSTFDFTRLQLYRDVSVYEELARRGKIVCNNLDATIGDFVSINQWASAGRRRLDVYDDIHHRRRHLEEIAPDLTDAQLELMTNSHHEGDEMFLASRECAPTYHMDCLFKKVGMRFQDS